MSNRYTEHRCGKPAAYRFTWPGHDESFVCEEHSNMVRNVAQATGFYLQLIPVSLDAQFQFECSQIVSSSGENSDNS